jgi:antitoxin ChpS
MDLMFRKIGDSTGLTFPSSFLREQGIVEGQIFSVEAKGDGTFTLQPKISRKRYSAKELNAQCDLNAPMPQDLGDWERAAEVGTEDI